MKLLSAELERFFHLVWATLMNDTILQIYDSDDVQFMVLESVGMEEPSFLFLCLAISGRSENLSNTISATLFD